jgi:hypothetical protein
VTPRRNFDDAVVEGVPAADLLVARHDLRHEIVLFHPRLEFRVAPGRMFEELRRAEQDDREFELGERHRVLLISRRGARARSARGAGGSKGAILQ